MPRRYRRHRRYGITRPVKTTKYSNETYGSQFSIDNVSGQVGSHETFQLPVVPDAHSVLGTRKAKNFTLRICVNDTLIHDGTQQNPDDEITARVAFALVYVPEGTNASTLQFGAGNNALSLYEPNQNVILAGIVDSQQTYTFKTRLARNLNSGDKIFLVFADLTGLAVATDTLSTPVTFSCNYAISF